MAWSTCSVKKWIIAGCILVAIGACPGARAGEIKITLPKRSQLTPVQRLNRKGVEEVGKRRYEKAEALFYRAYLLDPDDPFTLNNLGYISELQGQVDRALNFYQLAGEQATEAVIARASSPRVEGRSIKAALAIPDLPLQVNHDNVEAVRMLSQERAPEADLFLTKVLQKDPSNVFTLNNLGVAKEMEGESEEALKLYDQAAAANSNAAAVVTYDRAWRGKPVSQMAAENAKNLRTWIAGHQTVETRLAELSVRGVSALNRNDVRDAQQDFQAAYALDPSNAFALNNFGYVSELNGDRETAEFYYRRAQVMPGANLKVGLATRTEAEGSKLFRVASESGSSVVSKIAQEQAARRAQHAPVELLKRDNTPVQEKPAAPKQ
ncbi:MAG: tetratricopeptide repeat protein [Candidatus Sulfotelmatobacter sp.]